jgi:hypothetical protein
MAPSDRGKPGPDGAPERTDPPELSSRGKVVVRSSSHPPGADIPITDPPPPEMAMIAEALREKKDTPAERPRKRKKIQADRLAAEVAARVAAELAPIRAREEAEARALAQQRRETRRLWLVMIALASIAAAIHWLAR